MHGKTGYFLSTSDSPTFRNHERLASSDMVAASGWAFGLFVWNDQRFEKKSFDCQRKNLHFIVDLGSPKWKEWQFWIIIIPSCALVFKNLQPANSGPFTTGILVMQNEKHIKEIRKNSPNSFRNVSKFYNPQNPLCWKLKFCKFIANNWNRKSKNCNSVCEDEAIFLNSFH